MSVDAPYIGPDYLEARAMFHRALEAGMSHARAVVLANVASFVDGWVARKRLAKQARCDVRTSQRALTQGAELGLIGKARAKVGERMPGMKPGEFQTCGYSHRWTIGRGLAAAQAVIAVTAARAEAMARKLARKAARALNPKKKPEHRRYTDAELDAELAKRPREYEPDPEPPD